MEEDEEVDFGVDEGETGAVPDGVGVLGRGVVLDARGFGGEAPCGKIAFFLG